MEVENRENLRKVLEDFRKSGKKIVFTNGCFDILHPGHIHLLKKAKEKGDILVVGINSDNSIRRIKGKGRPIFSQEEREEILASLEMVDHVVIFGEDNPYNLIRELKPHVLVKGGDWRKDEVIGKDLVESWGGEVIIIPLKKGYSTSRILNIIRKRLL